MNSMSFLVSSGVKTLEWLATGGTLSRYLPSTNSRLIVFAPPCSAARGGYGSGGTRTTDGRRHSRLLWAIDSRPRCYVARATRRLETYFGLVLLCTSTKTRN